MNHAYPRNDVAMPEPALPGRAESWLRNLVIILAGSLFVAVCAHVTLPLNFTPVPLTLQPFAVMLLGLLLSPRLAAATMLAYLLRARPDCRCLPPGPMGLTGASHTFGPTGGYLMAYPPGGGLHFVPVARPASAALAGRAGQSHAAGSLADHSFRRGALLAEPFLPHASVEALCSDRRLA